MEATRPSGQPAGGARPVGTLRELLNTRWENVHLVHDEIDFLPHTIMELNRNTLTGAGKKPGQMCWMQRCCGFIRATGGCRWSAAV